jgi:ABC-type transport system involved in multi-copper enzyme maturation permease subunit
MMRTLLWAERQKLRRSNMVWVAFFATVLLAAIVLIGGQQVYEGARYIDKPGWFLSVLQPWATMLALPAVIALLGSYMICREQQDDTLKTLRMIPINEAKLTVAKMILAFVICVLLYLLLFVLAFAAEAALHAPALPAGMVLGFLKAYLIDGVAVFFAISPIIALVSRNKNGYWLALVFTELYSFTGLFTSMSNTLRAIYPMTAVFGLSGYYGSTPGQFALSCISLLACGMLAAIILAGQSKAAAD